MNQELLQTLTAMSGVGSVLSTSCAVYTVWRANQWRKEGAGRKATKAIATAQATADEAVRLAQTWHETEAAAAIKAAVAGNAGRIRGVEDRFAQMATKADVARIEGSIEGVNREVRSAVAGIDRIEGYFLEEGIKSRGHRGAAP